jgi:hypothetical protein
MLKKLFHIDNKEGNPDEQVLSLRIGASHCSYVITDLTGEDLFRLGYYSYETADHNPVELLYMAEPSLDVSFSKVLAGYDFEQSTLVPETYFKKEDANNLLQSLYGVNGTKTVVTEPVTDWQLFNVYAIPKEMHEWMKHKFTSGNYWHQYTIGLKNLVNVEEGQLFVDLRSTDFTVIATRGNQLLIAQTFLYSTPEDVLYYLLKLCQEFQLSQKTVRLSLSGLIEKNSALYKELYQYFIQLHFRESTWEVANAELPAHFFTSLNDLSRCAS